MENIEQKEPENQVEIKEGRLQEFLLLKFQLLQRLMLLQKKIYQNI